ncbi:MAG: family 43 glycosylhydrolase [Oscillospiraceae bacterium]|nr:family 43 glycosylhydrolase [Oscillospiraceae bacterium]
MKKKLLALTLALAMVLGMVSVADAAVYTVAAGDNLSRIAQSQLGDAARWKEIYEANKDTIKDPNKIYVGQVLEIPGAEPEQPAAETPDIYAGLVEFTAFGNSVAKPEQASGQQFLVNKEDAKTYINPLPLDYQRSSANDKGEISENPFMIGQLIGNVFIPMDPVEQITHIRFQDMFRGTSTYIAENDTRASADPSGFYYNDMWYLYGTNGSLWYSKDFVDWTFVQLKDTEGNDMSFTAPTIAVRTDENGKDTFYLAWNSSHLYSSDSPCGPFKDLGDFTYHGLSFKDNATTTEMEPMIIAAHNDVNIFVDDDNRMYLYWGMGPYISGAELNPANPTELITEPKILIEYDNEYKWQNFGQNHQDYENGFPEGSWMVKIDGTYYLTWATSGTQYDSYTAGCYQSTTGPLDGFELQEKEIVNQIDAVTGTVRGGGHGSFVQGPSDTLWYFYTVNVGYEGDMERRIGCDPAMIDADGNLVVPHLSEAPQYVPGVLANPADGNETGSDILTVKQGYAVSSYSEGRHPIYANDESMITWWQPAADDENPWYLVSFKGNYNVDSFRVIWKEINADRSVTLTDKYAIDYKIELFNGTTNPLDPANAGSWTTVYERTGETEIIDYVTLDQPVLAQFARITITGVSK